MIKNLKTVTIFGGGDSALDWAVELSKNSKVNLVHRRDDFRGAQATVDKVHELAKDGEIRRKKRRLHNLEVLQRKK